MCRSKSKCLSACELISVSAGQTAPIEIKHELDSTIIGCIHNICWYQIVKIEMKSFMYILADTLNTKCLVCPHVSYRFGPMAPIQ